MSGTRKRSIIAGTKIADRNNRRLAQQSQRRTRQCKRNLQAVLASAVSKNAAPQPSAARTAFKAAALAGTGKAKNASTDKTNASAVQAYD